MPNIHDISFQLEIIQKNKNKLQKEFPNLFSENENETFYNNKKLLNEHIQILLNYISVQGGSNENKKILEEPLKSIIRK